MCAYRKTTEEKQWKINESPSVVSMTSIPSGLTPVGKLQQGPKTQEIKHCRLLHPFTQQQEQHVAYRFKLKK